MGNFNKWLLRLTVVALIFIAITFNKIIEFVTNFLWFDKNGFIKTFLVRVFTKLQIGLPIWIIFSIFLFWYLQNSKKKYIKAMDIEKGNKLIRKIKTGINYFSVIFGGFVAYMITNIIWLDYLKFVNMTDFGKADPIFNNDIGFYIFMLPFLRLILGILIFMIVLMIGITFLFHGLMMATFQYPQEALTVDRIAIYLKDEIYKAAANRIAYFAFVGFLLLGGFFYLSCFYLLYSPRGVAFGASYTDIHITLLAYKTYASTSLITALLVLVGAKRKSLGIALIGPIAMVVIAIGFGTVGLVVQNLVVEPDEISKERQYLVYNIEHTQDAFNVGDVEFLEFPAEDNISKSVIERNKETVKNIRINDYRPLKQTYNQIQGIRLYYDFYDIDMDRYYIDGEYTQVFLSAREMDQHRLDDKAKTWLNKHLKYTHGHGIVMSPVNSVSDEGQPELLFKNIPPVTETGIAVNKPEIYFGEQTDTYIIVNTDEKEFDYPSGSNNVETMYDGDAGIELNGIKRWLFAFREGSFKMLVSNNVNPDSRIIINRNIIQRVKTIAPFLSYESDPYIVLNDEDGKLYWIIDAYTESKYYPYSQVFNFKGKKVNYLRNSVKVVIDAYEGTTKFYIYDEEDPIVQTYNKIFEDLFTPRSKMPESLKRHVRYPQDYFDIQAWVYRSYHVDNPVVFYNGEDVWDIANEKYMENVQEIESNYVMFKLEEEEDAEYLLIVPYTPKKKPNMTSLLVARSDGDHYGEVFAYRFPKDKTIQGPIMIESRVDQNSVISPQFTLWGQEGSQVLRGNLIVVPIESSLMYVEPIYIQADNPNSLPEMKRVIVAYKEKIVMERTLEEALNKLFDSEETAPGLRSQQEQIEELLKEIEDKFGDSKEIFEDLEKMMDELKIKIDEKYQ